VARRFWRDEYLLNGYIGRYPKPYVALMEGIVLGGGVGVSAHASIRVVTDRSKIAMPEAGIGFVPDVGGTHLLSRAPDLLGLHAGLTGAPFSGSDAIAIGFADHYVPHQALPAFTKATAEHGIDAALHGCAVAPPISDRVAQRDWIDECYAADTVADIVAALRAHDAGPAQPTTQPTSSLPDRRCRSRSRWKRCVAPRNSTTWKTLSVSSIGCRARHCAPTI
jgi:enoyl-CoA hydratase/carnithine racemase